MDDSTLETWKPVPGYEGSYEVSDHGRVRSLSRWRKGSYGCQYRSKTITLKQGLGKVGYYVVGLTRDGKTRTVNVHALVAEAFLGPRPKGIEVNHRDGVKTNNHLSNLEYVTSRGNSRHAVSTGLFNPRTQVGASSTLSKLTEAQVREIRRRFVRGLGPALGREYGVSSQQIYAIVHRRAWTHLTD